MEHNCCDNAKIFIGYAEKYQTWFLDLDGGSMDISHCPWCGEKLLAFVLPASDSGGLKEVDERPIRNPYYGGDDFMKDYVTEVRVNPDGNVGIGAVKK